jgi:uncharacterized protein
MAERPVPQMNPVTAPFWEACNRGELMLQRCSAPACRRFVFYPRVCCPFCQNGDLEWTQASGRGRILSFAVVHRPQHEFFYSDAPIWFVAIELEEGPVIFGHLLDAADSTCDLVGGRVRVVMVEARVGVSLPSFVMAERDSELTGVDTSHA